MSRVEELEQIQRAMRERGHRWTSQRQLVTRVAFAHHAHFAADELLALCQRQDQDVSRATVYRTLQLLEDAGFVAGLDTGDGGRKFEHVLGHDHHDHMVCNACGVILEFKDDALEALQEKAAQRRGFLIQSHSLKLFGLCAGCQAAGKKPRKGRHRAS